MPDTLADDDDWKRDALCRELVATGVMVTDDWFPKRIATDGSARNMRVQHDDVNRLRTICAQCPVLVECRSAALAYRGKDFSGFFGGMTPTERREWRRIRRLRDAN